MKRKTNDNQPILTFIIGKPTGAMSLRYSLLVLLRASHMKLQK